MVLDSSLCLINWGSVKGVCKLKTNYELVFVKKCPRNLHNTFFKVPRKIFFCHCALMWGKLHKNMVTYLHKNCHWTHWLGNIYCKGQPSVSALKGICFINIMVTDRQVKHVPISTSHLVIRMIYSLISTKQVAKMEGDQGSAHNISFVTKVTTARHLGYSHKQN